MKMRLPSTLCLLLAFGCSSSGSLEGTMGSDGPYAKTRTVSGRLEVAQFQVDRAEAVAIAADGRIFHAPLAADGSFSLTLPTYATYALRFANTTGTDGVLDAFAVMVQKSGANRKQRSFTLTPGDAMELGRIARVQTISKGLSAATDDDDDELDETDETETSSDADDIDDDSDVDTDGTTSTATATDADADSDSEADSDSDSDSSSDGTSPQDDDLEVCDLAGGAEMAEVEPQNNPLSNTDSDGDGVADDEDSDDCDSDGDSDSDSDDGDSNDADSDSDSDADDLVGTTTSSLSAATSDDDDSDGSDSDTDSDSDSDGDSDDIVTATGVCEEADAPMDDTCEGTPPGGGNTPPNPGNEPPPENTPPDNQGGDPNGGGTGDPNGGGGAGDPCSVSEDCGAGYFCSELGACEPAL